MTRRSRGDGSLSQRRDGRWEARIALPWVDGHRHRRTFYGHTRAEVKQKMDAALGKQRLGLPLPPERLTLRAHLEAWLQSKKKTLRPETWRAYSDRCRIYIVPHLGHRRLVQLTIADVESLHEHVASRVSGTTAKHVHDVLRNALQDAVRWDLVARNVAALVPAPRRSTAEMRFLNANGARALLGAAKGNPLETLFTVALTCGLRSGEVRALRWKDVDFDRRRLRVTATLTAIGEDGSPIFGEPKTQHSRRTVWLTETAADALERHQVNQDVLRRLAGPAWVEHELVFTTPRGLPLWRSQIRREWTVLLGKAELPPMRFHDLRHTAASLLLSEGVSVKVVSEMLGHSDVKTTLSIYAHVIEGAQEQATSAMDRLLHA